MRFVAILLALPLLAQEDPKGRIIDRVECTSNRSQAYALYLPSNYTPDRPWPVIFAFDPRANGRTPVELYQAAAEKYGYIVAGSLNSRNGPWEISENAKDAMTRDVAMRFKIDPRRVYAAGMSGGSRVAFSMALDEGVMFLGPVAGVLGSSAGYPDGHVRDHVNFAVFATAGTEDFNYIEMRTLDRVLESPHRLAIFEGGHQWLSSELATEGIEWMEIQAMKTHRKPANDAEIDVIFAKRVAAIAQGNSLEALKALRSLVDDFDGLRDIKLYVARATDLLKRSDVQAEIRMDQEILAHEKSLGEQITSQEERLEDTGERADALTELTTIWKKLTADSRGETDSAERRLARRVIRGYSVGIADRVSDDEYVALVRDAARIPR